MCLLSPGIEIKGKEINSNTKRTPQETNKERPVADLCSFRNF
jgi:hypothetical protein